MDFLNYYYFFNLTEKKMKKNKKTIKLVNTTTRMHVALSWVHSAILINLINFYKL